ncbi:MAG: DUF2971 domain-containing protein [Saccharofermentans sp.]|nr:DUF2971 domain-containing protein [Saccharofermentans sp.]
MYLNCLVNIPEAPGKLVFHKKKDTTYVYYEIDRKYDSVKQQTTPKRVAIGKQSKDDLSLMQPNENFIKFFPDVTIPDVELPLKIELTSGFPQLFYKYKSLDSVKDRKYVFDIIDNHRLFFPKYELLNDPLEGSGYNISFGENGWAGMNLQIHADVELSPILAYKNRFRILSLSANPTSPQMWALYANEFNGVCFCFRSNKSLIKAKQVQYGNLKDKVIPRSNIMLKNAVYKGFFNKEIDWLYEREWRIVDESYFKYFYFDSDELVGIIIGHKTKKRLQKELLKVIPDNVVVLKTKVRYRSNQIGLIPYEYEEFYTGDDIPFIEDLTQYLL